jgi:DnaJ like chaperone protein
VVNSLAWVGKLVFSTFGLMLAGRLGALLGATIGHRWPGSSTRWGAGFMGIPVHVDSAFFAATFTLMGHIAKADGRVSPAEIQAAETVMARLRLDAGQRRIAIAFFRQGKQPDLNLDPVLESLRRELRFRHDLAVAFLEIQLHAAYADGSIHPSARRTLLRIRQSLRISAGDYMRVEDAVGAARHGYYGSQRGGRTSSEDGLGTAYAILGVAPSAAPEAVKRAYRRLLSQHHPDKLAAQGLPAQDMKSAADRTHEIRRAYERIRNARGF